MNFVDRPDNLYKKILNKIARKYRRYLTKSEIQQAKYIAIWKSLQKKDKLDVQFQTILYNNMVWECIAILREREHI